MKKRGGFRKKRYVEVAKARKEYALKAGAVMGSLAYYGEFAPAINLVADGGIDAKPLVTGKIRINDMVKRIFRNW